MAKITIEETTLRELMEKASKEVAIEFYIKGWRDAASATRSFSVKLKDSPYKEILIAVADSLEESSKSPNFLKP